MDKFVVRRPRSSTVDSDDVGDAPSCSSSSLPPPSAAASTSSSPSSSPRSLRVQRGGAAAAPTEPPAPGSQPPLTAGKKGKRKESGAFGLVRTFQRHWVEAFPWLEYDESKDAAFCAVCKLAFQQKCVVFSKRASLTFIETGFSGWRKGLERFRNHQKSECHRESLLKTQALGGGRSVCDQLNEAQAGARAESREALLKILSSLQYLAVQGQAIRGHVDASSNLTRLLRLRCQDSDVLKRWMRRNKYRWCSHEVCNEMLEIMSHHLTRSLLARISQARHYAVMVDETADISVQEQVSICFRIVGEDLEVEELFMGFHSTANTRAETLFRILRDVLCRFDLPLANCRGQCFDGAQNMAGIATGVQARVRQLEPRAVFVHCMAHSLSLTVQHFIRQVGDCYQALSNAQELITFIRDSPKRYAIFKDLQVRLGDRPATSAHSLRPFCATRWTVRCQSLSSVLGNYKQISETLAELVESESHTDSAMKARGLQKFMRKFSFFFHITLLCRVLSRVDAANTALQGRALDFTRGAGIVSRLVETLQGFREDFDAFWTEVLSESQALSLEPPKAGRARKVPARLDEAANRGMSPFQTSRDSFRQIFCEVVDNALQCIRARFQSPVFELMSQAESFLAGSIRAFSAPLRDHFGGDVDQETLLLHRDMLLDSARRADADVSSVSSVMDFLKGRPQLKEMLPELVKFLRLILTVPVSTATAERSFSALRRLKTFLRSTVTQQRLNHLAMLEVHEKRAEELNLEAVADDFISRNEIRKAAFATRGRKT